MVHPQQGPWSAQPVPQMQTHSETPQESMMRQPINSAPGTTEFWLDSGAPLPRRMWQHRTRVPIIVGTSIAMVVFAALAVFAIVLGIGNSQQFTAVGGVPVSCDSWETAATGGTISERTAVTIYSETGDKLATTPLERYRTHDGQCVLKFSVDVDAGRSGYVVHVGDGFAQPVSPTALQSGVVLRPTS